MTIKFEYKYDAWNRLVQVYLPVVSSTNPYVQYEYDGIFNSRGDELDDKIEELNFRRDAASDPFDLPRNFRRNQLTGADNAKQDIRDLTDQYQDFVITATLAPTSGTGFSGRKGFELKNHLGQPVRNAETNINGRNFSGHAFDQMQNRGIPPSVVDNAIKHGRPFAGNRPGTQGFFDPVNKVRVIINSETGQVITVIPGGG